MKVYSYKMKVFCYKMGPMGGPGAWGPWGNPWGGPLGEPMGGPPREPMAGGPMGIDII